MTNFGLSYCVSNGRKTRILVLTGIGPDSSSQMLVAKKTFLGTLVFLFLEHMSLRNLAYDGTYWIASRRGTFILTWLKISIIISMCAVCLLFFSLLGNGTIGLCTWLVDLSFSDSSDLKELGLDEVNAYVWLYWMGLDGVDTWLSTFFPDLNVWTILHWFNSWSLAKWVWWEFLGFVTGWLGKVPFSLSFCEVANWLIWISSLVMTYVWLLCIICMRDSWFFMYLSMSFSKLVILFSNGGFWKEYCGAWLGKFCW